MPPPAALRADPEDWEPWVIEGFGVPENPVPRDASAPRAEGGGGGNVGHSFDIKLGQAAAQAAVEAAGGAEGGVEEEVEEELFEEEEEEEF